MLLLYYTHTILFLLSLSKPKPNSSFTKYLTKYDIQYLPQEVCIAQCLGNVSMYHKSSSVDIVASHVEVIAEFEQNRSLEHCVKHCTELSSTNKNTAPIKKIHENYSLNLICRDENSLNFLINLHATNMQGKNRIKQFGETDGEASAATTTSSAPLLSSATPLTSVIPDNDGGTAIDDADVVLFVIKIHLANETDIYKVYLSDDKFFTLEQLSPNATYNITAFAVHSQNKYSVIALGEQFQTLRRSYTPGNITNIKVINFREDLENPSHLSATVMWKPPPDMTCYYDIICFSPISNDFEMQPVEIRNPRKLYKYQLDNMTFSTEYKVGIRAKNIKNMKESELFWKTFNAPSCVEWHNYNFNVCAPDAPENLQYQLYYSAQNLYSLNVSWDRPTHYPDNYTLSIKDLSPLGQGYYFNISRDVNNFFIEDIEIYSSYFHVLLTASTMGGNSTSLAVKTSDAVIQFPEKNHFVKLFVVILAPICCVAILSLTIFMIFHRRAKLKRYQERCKYFEELEKKAPIDPKDNFDFAKQQQGPTLDLHISMENEDTTTALFNDEMEIDRSQLTLYEVLGEGAFGLVKRGIYKDNKYNNGGGIVHEVAVKMLKDHPTADDVRAFRREIEVMKSVEKHPNIVGILGHCTRLSNEMMLLTEYCSFGNLLDFLRDEWRFLHEIQQKRQKHTSIIIDVELPHVPERHASDGNNVQRTLHKTMMVTSSPPNSPAPPIPQCNKSSVKPVANGENINNRVEELKNVKNKTQSKLSPSMAGDDNGATFNSSNNEFIIEQFKMKYNDLGKHECDSGQKGKLSEIVSKIYPTVWANNATRIIDTRGPTTCKDIKTRTTTTSSITSPAAENKSYGYEGCCTNACKCNVDVIIRNIDSSDSSREQEELDRLLLKHQNTAQLCATTIAINNCDCRKAKSLSSSSMQPSMPPPPTPPEIKTIPGKNAVDNKSYFKFFRGNSNKTQTLHRHHSTIGSNSTNTTESTTADSFTSATNEALTTNNINNENNDECGGNWPQRVPLKSGDLLDIARQVAVGMDFLARNKVVHRDLAARNVLVAPDRTIKIADFGLSRDVYQENIYKKTGNGKLPIKWLALESLTHQVYTTQSDVWSYGILLYEIVTLGATPYPSIPTNRLLHLLKTGYRMEKPRNCGDEFYALMYSCWNAVPNERPSFVEIQNNLDIMLNKSNTPTLTPTTNSKVRTRPTLTLPIPRNQVCCVADKKTIHCSDVESNHDKDMDEEQDNNEIDEDIYVAKQESPVLQLCPDDSYLSPL